MKKVLYYFFTFFLFFCFLPIPYQQAVDTSSLTTYSPYILLLDAQSGKILYEKNAYEKTYPASTTKMMTALLTLENCHLEDVAEVSPNAVHSIPSGYAHADLKIGEKLTIEQLLHVLLIPSANDAAVVLAEHIAGSVESFCSMMNTRAIELGCKNTNFVNPNGIHHIDHYSNAYDLALIAKEVIKYDDFIRISTKTSYTLPKTEKYDKEDRTFTTTNSLLRSSSMYYYETCNGIKTGYTDAAGNCIVAGAKKDGIQLIAVILKSFDTENGLTAKYLDCKNLFNFGFDNYTQKQLTFQDQAISTTKIPNATSQTKELSLFPKENLVSIIDKSLSSEITPQITLKEDLKAPIQMGETVGKVSYQIDGSTYETDLIAGSHVEESEWIVLAFQIAIVFFLFYGILRLFIFRKKMKEKRLKKKMRNSRKINVGRRYK